MKYARCFQRGVLAWLAVPVIMALNGCSMLPIDGPMGDDVHDEAELDKPPFRLVQVTADNIAMLRGEREPLPTVAPVLEGGDPKIGPGDIIDVTVVETASGGLFSGLAGISAGGSDEGARITTLPGVQVDSQGIIRFPFTGSVKVAGLTLPEISQELETRLGKRAIQPQVLVTVTKNLHNKVLVWGNVRAGGWFDLTPAGETILQVIAEAGGPLSTPADTMVALSRDAVIHRFPLKALIDNPTLDRRMQRGDSINVYPAPRSYIVFGASKVARYPLPEQQLTLAEALGSAGGLLDMRAAAQTVFLFRYEPGPPTDRITNEPRVPAPEPVIYEVNMRLASGIFLAQKIDMRDKDIVYVPNSKEVQWNKFLSLLRGDTSSVTVTAKDSSTL